MIKLTRRASLKVAVAAVLSSLPVRLGWAAQVIFQAEGLGSDLAEAKQQALSMLSQQILAEVRTEVSQSVKTQNGQVSRQASVQRQVRTHLLLKGVKYRVLEAVPGTVRVLAYMDGSAIEQTVRFLQDNTDFQPETLALADVPALREKARMLQAILLALPASIKERFKADLERVQQKLLWLSKRETEALWILNLQGKPVQIWVDGRRISAQSPIFLPPGRHDYRLLSDGFKPVEGVLQVYAGQRITQTVDWIPARQPVAVALQVSPELDFIPRTQWQAWLEDVGLQLSPHAMMTLKVALHDEAVTVENFKRHRIKLSLAFYKEDRRLKRLRTRFEVMHYVDDPRPFQHTIREKLAKALRILVSKTPLDEEAK